MADFIRLRKSQSAAISVAANHPPTKITKFMRRVIDGGGTIMPESQDAVATTLNDLAAAGVTPSLVMVPSGGKAGTLYSEIPTDGTGDFTVARNSVKQVLSKDGYYREVAVNVPALEWSPTAQKFGVLTEAQRTNLLLWSWNFGNPYWAKSGVVISGDISTRGSTLNVSNCINETYTTFEAASPTGFRAAMATSKSGVAGTADEIVFTLGKLYCITFNLTIASGQLPSIRARLSHTSTTISDTFATASGANIFYISPSITNTGVLNFLTSNATDFTVSNLNITEVERFECPFINLKRGIKLSATTANGYIRLATALTVTAATAYTNSIFVKRITGTGAVSLIDTNGTDRAITITNDWKPFSYTATSAGTTGQIGIKLATSGDEVMICQSDVVQAAASGSPIFTDGATVTRLADVQTIEIPAGVSEITTTVDGVDVVDSSPTPGDDYTIPDGFVTKIVMI